MEVVAVAGYEKERAGFWLWVEVALRRLVSWGSLRWYEQSSQRGRAGSCHGGVVVLADHASGSLHCVAALQGSAARSPSCLSCRWCMGPAVQAGWGCPLGCMGPAVQAGRGCALGCMGPAVQAGRGCALGCVGPAVQAGRGCALGCVGPAVQAGWGCALGCMRPMVRAGWGCAVLPPVIGA